MADLLGLGGYGSDDSDDREEEPVAVRKLPSVSAAPVEPAPAAPPAAPRGVPEGFFDAPEPSKPAGGASGARLVAPSKPLRVRKLPLAPPPFMALHSGHACHPRTSSCMPANLIPTATPHHTTMRRQEDEDDDAGMLGPARPPPRPVADESEIPSTSQPELWSKLPAPKTARRVVTLQLPLNKAFSSEGRKVPIDSDEEDEAVVARRKRLRAAAPGTTKLTELLPPPKNTGARIALGAGAGLGGGTKMGMGKKALPGRGRRDDDSDDEDPMDHMGPMPDAGAYAAGPAADEGEEVGVAGDGAGPSSYGAHAAAEYATAGHYGQQQQHHTEAHAASAYFVGGGGGAQYEQYQYDAAQYSGMQYGAGGSTAASADPGQVLFEEALKAEAGKKVCLVCVCVCVCLCMCMLGGVSGAG